MLDVTASPLTRLGVFVINASDLRGTNPHAQGAEFDANLGFCGQPAPHLTSKYCFKICRLFTLLNIAQSSGTSDKRFIFHGRRIRS
jgi:hypothetical protein